MHPCLIQYHLCYTYATSEHRFFLSSSDTPPPPPRPTASTQLQQRQREANPPPPPDDLPPVPVVSFVRGWSAEHNRFYYSRTADCVVPGAEKSQWTAPTEGIVRCRLVNDAFPHECICMICPNIGLSCASGMTTQERTIIQIHQLGKRHGYCLNCNYVAYYLVNFPTKWLRAEFWLIILITSFLLQHFKMDLVSTADIS